jgi:hypothetical protein
MSCKQLTQKLHYFNLKTMKSKVKLALILLVLCLGISFQSNAQVGTITVKWEDNCVPVVNNTDYYIVSLSVYRNIDGEQLCNINSTVHTEPYSSTTSTWLLPTCNCADVAGGYHIIAIVKRYNHDNNLICTGTTELNRSCPNLTNLVVKVNLPS